MRTGAIFARGSCRALNWMALVGMVFALGASSAAAQLTLSSTDEGTSPEATVTLATAIADDGTPRTFTLTVEEYDGDVPLLTGRNVAPDDSLTADAGVALADPATITVAAGEKTGKLLAALTFAEDVDAEDEYFELVATDSSTTPATVFRLPVIVMDDEDQEYTLELPTEVEGAITEGADAQMLTLTAKPARSVDIAVEMAVNPNDPMKYTLGGVMNSNDSPAATSTFGTEGDNNPVTATIQALADGDRMLNKITVTAYTGTLAAREVIKSLEIDVKDANPLPMVTAMVVDDEDGMALDPQPTSIDEGDTVMVKLTVVDEDGDETKAVEDLSVRLMQTGTASAADYRLGMNPIEISKDAMSSAMFELEARPDQELDADEMLVFDAVVSGDSEIGAGTETSTGVLSLEINDETGEQVWVLDDAEDEIDDKMGEADGTDGKLNPGENFTLMVSDLFGVATGYEIRLSVGVSGSAVTHETIGGSITIKPQETTTSPNTSTVTLTATAVPMSSSFVGNQISPSIAEIMFDVTVEAAATTAPAAPAMPDLTPTARGSLTVMWEAPADGGSPIVDYDVRYREVGDTDWGVRTDLTQTSTMLEELGDDTTWEAQVMAFNANGASPWSESGRGTTMPAPVTRAKRGQITEFKLIGAVEEKTIGGIERLFVDEGEQDVELSVTVQWTHEEIHQIGYEQWQYIHVRIKENRAAGPPSGAGNWLSWIDYEGDVHFPQSSTRNSGYGRLGGWVRVKTPKESDIPVAQRRSPNRVMKSAPGKLPVLVLHDNHEAENDAFYIEAEDSMYADVDLHSPGGVNTITPEVVIDDDEEQKVTVKGPTTVYESAGTAEYTLGASPQRVELPLDVVLEMLDLEGVTVSAAQISVSDASVQIGTGASAPKVTVHLPASDGNRVDNDYQMQASVNLYSLTSGGFDTIKTKSAPIKVVDVHKLPWLTVSPVSGAVAEGGEVELTLKVNRNPANTIATDPEKRQYTSEALTIAVTTGGSASSSDFTMTPSSISVEEYTSAVHRAANPKWEQSVKVKVTATEDEDIDAEMLTLGFVVNGTEDGDYGPRPSVDDGARPEDYNGAMAEATLTIQDATDTLVSVRENAYDIIKGALGDPPMLTTGMSAELMGSTVFDYGSAAVSVADA
ncbi:MAG: fibronectin type III domain-containing protein, partial [Rhodococcus sp.]|nr:fibronectin type III domain-containing protein [Rhodococcus sp. (in: high G+C Gram-positive bacteria)]